MPEKESSSGPTISVVIPTYNAERTLEQCLASTDWADEVIVVDMYSNDRTLEICGRHSNTRVFQRRDYIFANVNYGIDQARGEWIIRHDSDEMFTPELRDEILRKRADGSLDELDGYHVAELINHFGTWLPNGVPGRTGREKLFRKGFAWYEVKGEHEHPTIKGRWGYLENVYLHDSNPTLAYMLKKFIYYAERDAERADLSSAKAPWYIAYRTMKAFFTTAVRMRRNFGPAGRHLYPILSMVWAFKYFLEESLVWERAQGAAPKDDRDPGSITRDFGSSVKPAGRADASVRGS